MTIIWPRFACYKLVAVVDTIIGVLNQGRFNAAQRFVRGGHFKTLTYSMAAFPALACIATPSFASVEYVTNGSIENNAGIGQFQL
jgi:hypothetical protein